MHDYLPLMITCAVVIIVSAAVISNKRASRHVDECLARCQNAMGTKPMQTERIKR